MAYTPEQKVEAIVVSALWSDRKAAEDLDISRRSIQRWRDAMGSDPEIRSMVQDRFKEMRAEKTIPLRESVFEELTAKFGSIEDASNVIGQIAICLLDVFEELVVKLGSIQRAATAIEQIALSLLEEGDDPNIDHRNHIDGTTRYDVLYRAGFKCQACGAQPDDTNDVELHIDHIVPDSWGGSDDPDNLQCLCARCNMSKGDRYAYDHNKGQLLIPFE